MENIKIVEEIARIDTSYNGRMSYIGLYIKEGQYGEFFSIEKHGEDMKPKYLSLTLVPSNIKELGKKLIEFVESREST